MWRLRCLAMSGNDVTVSKLRFLAAQAEIEAVCGALAPIIEGLDRGIAAVALARVIGAVVMQAEVPLRLPLLNALYGSIRARIPCEDQS